MYKLIALTVAVSVLLTYLLRPGDEARGAERPLALPHVDAPVVVGASEVHEPGARAGAGPSVDAALEPDLSAPLVAVSDGRHLDPRDFASAEEMLAAHWGAHWPAVRAELIAAGLDLDAYPFEELKSWTELRVELTDHFLADVDSKRQAAYEASERWSSLEGAAELAGVSLPEDPSAAGVEEVWREVQSFNERIDSLVVNIHSAMELALLDAIDDPTLSTVHPIGAPAEAIGLQALNQNEFVWGQSKAWNGWTIEVYLRRSKRPEFAFWLDELEVLQVGRREFLVNSFGG